MNSTQQNTNTFGRLLKDWRGARGCSQLTLALDAEVSSRHLSFIENGRSHPSREMVLRLIDALNVPLRERNNFLNAAGYADFYRHSALADDTLEHARNALTFMLEKHEPYPAFVIDRLSNVLMSNSACQRLLEFCGVHLDPSSSIGGNILRLTLHPEGLRPSIENWTELAKVILHRMRREAAAAYGDDPLKDLLDEVMEYPDMPLSISGPDAADMTKPVIPLVLRRGDTRLEFSTIIATFGTPQDVTLQEIRLETLTPADAATAQFANTLAN